MRKNEKKCCCLEKIKKGNLCKLNTGDELKLITKSGKRFNGILFEIKDGYVQTVAQMGILMLFPIKSLMNIYQI